MAGETYKCPSCGSSLEYNPDGNNWRCDHCDTTYDEKTLLEKAGQYQREAEAEAGQAETGAHAHEHPHAAEPAQPAPSEAAEAEGTGAQLEYHCPNCGSEIITDETTVATRCYYCHSPVVLHGKVTAAMKPDKVLPFTIGKERAIDSFMHWVSKKRFVPAGFFARGEVTQMEGVYYPHFVSEVEMDGAYDGQGSRSTVMDQGQYIVTTTEHFAIRRRADLKFANVMRPALKKANRKLSDGIHPFPLGDVKPFSGAYLTGFLAERRDIEEADATADVADELTGYVQPMLTQTIHLPVYTGHTTAHVTHKSSQYVLLPTWVLTYPKAGEKEPYYYVMNGCTGEVCGKLPINKGKLRLYGLGLAALCFALYCVAAYFLF